MTGGRMWSPSDPVSECHDHCVCGSTLAEPVSECADPYHEGLSEGERYEIPALEGSGWSTDAYRCPSCGFEPVSVTYFQPVDRTCRDCNAVFGADPEDPNDVRCPACFGVQVKKRIDEMIASGEL